MNLIVDIEFFILLSFFHLATKVSKRIDLLLLLWHLLALVLQRLLLLAKVWFDIDILLYLLWVAKVELKLLGSLMLTHPWLLIIEVEIEVWVFISLWTLLQHTLAMIKWIKIAEVLFKVENLIWILLCRWLSLIVLLVVWLFVVIEEFHKCTIYLVHLRNFFWLIRFTHSRSIYTKDITYGFNFVILELLLN